MFSVGKNTVFVYLKRLASKKEFLVVDKKVVRRKKLLLHQNFLQWHNMFTHAHTDIQKSLKLWPKEPSEQCVYHSTY